MISEKFYQETLNEYLEAFRALCQIEAGIKYGSISSLDEVMKIAKPLVDKTKEGVLA